MDLRIEQETIGMFAKKINKNVETLKITEKDLKRQKGITKC